MRTTTQRMKELISKKGISQKQLAKISGLTESTISHYVRGERIPRGVNLIKIAKALDTTTDYLLGNEENEDFDYVKSLIARNSSRMTNDEKTTLVKLLFEDD
ncbi:helix-turn-helix domain-containing protein [Anaerostipes sp.]|uniref:helix-turn-helix domain-containing protein n=1 Tax=Anaerostipes sp. TaxID=1872530 RepID=UPI003966FE9A